MKHGLRRQHGDLWAALCCLWLYSCASDRVDAMQWAVHTRCMHACMHAWTGAIMTGSPAGQCSGWLMSWPVGDLSVVAYACGSMSGQLLHHLGYCLHMVVHMVIHTAKADYGCSLAAPSVAHKPVLGCDGGNTSMCDDAHPCRHGMQVWHQLWGAT